MKKNPVMFALLVVMISVSAYAKAPSYQCDDGVKDGGYRLKVTDLNEQVQHVVIFAKSKITTSYVDDMHLEFKEKVGKFSTYEFAESDHRLQMTVSIPDYEGKRSAVFLMTDKKGTKRIPESGNIICNKDE